MFQFNRRLSNGLQVQASYTEARATDNGQTSQTFTASNNVLNPFDLELEQASSNFEIRHRFVANAIWSPSYGSEGSALRTVLTGFTISPTLAVSSGVPYTAALTGNTPNTARVSDGRPRRRGFNRLPSIERNAFHLPKTANVDLRVSRAFSLTAGNKVEGILDVFNLFNRLNHTAVNIVDVHGGRNRRRTNPDLQPDVRVADQREQQLLRVHASPGAARGPLHVLISGLWAQGSRLWDRRLICKAWLWARGFSGRGVDGSCR